MEAVATLKKSNQVMNNDNNIHYETWDEREERLRKDPIERRTLEEVDQYIDIAHKFSEQEELLQLNDDAVAAIAKVSKNTIDDLLSANKFPRLDTFIQILTPLKLKFDIENKSGKKLNPYICSDDDFKRYKGLKKPYLSEKVNQLSNVRNQVVKKMNELNLTSADIAKEAMIPEKVITKMLNCKKQPKLDTFIEMLTVLDMKICMTK